MLRVIMKTESSHCLVYTIEFIHVTGWMDTGQAMRGDGHAATNNNGQE